MFNTPRIQAMQQVLTTLSSLNLAEFLAEKIYPQYRPNAAHSDAATF